MYHSFVLTLREIRSKGFLGRVKVYGIDAAVRKYDSQQPGFFCREEELADCFDALCPCGKEHSGDTLRKQKDWLIADLQRALVWEIEVAPTLSRNEV